MANKKDGEVTLAEKPLSSTQLGSLRKLVEGDFEDLHTQVFKAIENRASEQLEALDLEAENKRLKVAAYIERARVLAEELREQVAAFHAEIDADPDVVRTSGRNGFEPIVGVSVHDGYLNVADYADEHQRVLQATQRLRNEASTVLSRLERRAQRDILLQGIGAGGAMEMIRDLPEADDVLVQVSEHLATTRSKDLETVQGLLEGAQKAIGAK